MKSRTFNKWATLLLAAHHVRAVGRTPRIFLSTDSAAQVRPAISKAKQAQGPGNSDDTTVKKSRLKKPFQLFPDPIFVVPSFDIQRRLGNLFSQVIYGTFFEKEFTLAGFLNGASQAAALCSQHISHKNWDLLSSFMQKETVEELRERCKSLSANELSDIMFTVDDVAYSFLHTSLITGRHLLRLSPVAAFYAHAVMYVRKDDSLDMDVSPQRFLKSAPPGAVLIANITLSRMLTPLGIWKVQRVNFASYWPDS